MAKLWKFFLIGLAFLSLKVHALSLEAAEKFDEANQAYILFHFEEAKIKYQDFITKAQSQKPNITDKKLIESAKESLKEIDFLLTHKNLILLFKQAPLLETINTQEARDAYLQIHGLLREQKITTLPYFSQISQGILEQYLVQKKKDSLENFSAAALEKIRIDKERKKTISFFPFQKDTRVEFDIETLVVQNLTNIIQSSRSFFINSKKFQGSLEEQLELAKEANIDLAVIGNYQKATGKSIMLHFIVFDTYKKKQLIDVTVKAPLDFDFFDTIEKVAGDLNKNLRNYSRLEDFESIRYKKEEGKQLVKEVLNAEETENIVLYVEEKILYLESLYISQFFYYPQGVSKTLPLALQEINQFNQRDLLVKIDKELILSNNRKQLVKSFSKETKLNVLLQELDKKEKQKKLKGYDETYQKAKNILNQGKKDLKEISLFLYEDLEVPLNQRKAQLAEIALQPQEAKEVLPHSKWYMGGAVFYPIFPIFGYNEDDGASAIEFGFSFILGYQIHPWLFLSSNTSISFLGFKNNWEYSGETTHYEENEKISASGIVQHLLLDIKFLPFSFYPFGTVGIGGGVLLHQSYEYSSKENGSVILEDKSSPQSSSWGFVIPVGGGFAYHFSQSRLKLYALYYLVKTGFFDFQKEENFFGLAGMLSLQYEMVF